MSTGCVNPNVIIQSSLALTIAIAVTDALRECVTALRPHNIVKVAILRVVVAILVIIFALVFVGYIYTGNTIAPYQVQMKPTTAIIQMPTPL